MMTFEEYALARQVVDLLEATGDRGLNEVFQQPQVQPKNFDQMHAHMKQWWSNWTDPRGKVEKAKRLIQDVMNIVGREGMRGKQGQDLIPFLTDLRQRLINLFNTMPSPEERAKYSLPKVGHDGRIS